VDVYHDAGPARPRSLPGGFKHWHHQSQAADGAVSRVVWLYAAGRWKPSGHSLRDCFEQHRVIATTWTIRCS